MSYHPPTDDQEEDRAKTLFENQWLGPLSLGFLVMCFVTFIKCCVGEAKGAECTFAWDSQPDATRFRLYCGLTLLAEVQAPVTQATVMLPDAPCEVSLVAINNYGTSPPATLKVSFIQPQESDDLKAWIPLRGYHHEFLPGRRFYRTRIETPP